MKRQIFLILFIAFLVNLLSTLIIALGGSIFIIFLLQAMLVVIVGIGFLITYDKLFIIPLVLELILFAYGFIGGFLVALNPKALNGTFFTSSLSSYLELLIDIAFMVTFMLFTRKLGKTKETKDLCIFTFSMAALGDLLAMLRLYMLTKTGEFAVLFAIILNVVVIVLSIFVVFLCAVVFFRLNREFKDKNLLLNEQLKEYEKKMENAKIEE